MDSSGRLSLRRRWASCAVLAAASCLAAFGCTSGDGAARRWIDPLGITDKPKEPGKKPDLRKRIANDPFPSASQVGLAAPQKAEAK